MAKVKLTRLDEVPLSEIFFEMLSIARKNKVILEANFTTLIIGTVVIEGTSSLSLPIPPVGPRLAVDVWLTTHNISPYRSGSTAGPRPQSPTAGSSSAGQGPRHSRRLHQSPPLGPPSLALPTSDISGKSLTPQYGGVFIGDAVSLCTAGTARGQSQVDDGNILLLLLLSSGQSALYSSVVTPRREGQQRSGGLDG
jgi:hypothetical protein